MKQVVGFTLIEILIVISLVSILAMIAIPTYQKYTRRAYYSELIQAAAPYQLGVAECFQELGDLDGCNAGVNNVPAAIANPQGAIAQVNVERGVIILQPLPQHGIEVVDDYILTPKIDGESLGWQVSGGALIKGYVRSRG